MLLTLILQVRVFLQNRGIRGWGFFLLVIERFLTNLYNFGAILGFSG